MNNFGSKANFIWKIAELLRGPYRPEKYGDVVLPMAVLRRFDCVLASTKQAVIEKAKTTDSASTINRCMFSRGNFIRHYRVNLDA